MHRLLLAIQVVNRVVAEVRKCLADLFDARIAVIQDTGSWCMWL